jgi:hypothetical protein
MAAKYFHILARKEVPHDCHIWMSRTERIKILACESQMSAFEEDRIGPLPLLKDLRSKKHTLQRIYPSYPFLRACRSFHRGRFRQMPQQKFHFRNIRCHDSRNREQLLDHHLHCLMMQERMTGGRNADGIADERGDPIGFRVPSFECVNHGNNICTVVKHASLNCQWGDVAEDRFDLRTQRMQQSTDTKGKKRPTCCSTNTGGHGCTACTPVVFCAVRAVTALIP